jgi:hypothetical protein
MPKGLFLEMKGRQRLRQFSRVRDAARTPIIRSAWNRRSAQR